MSRFSLHQLSKLVMKVLFLTDISCFAIADPRGMGLQTASGHSSCLITNREARRGEESMLIPSPCMDCSEATD